MANIIDISVKKHGKYYVAEYIHPEDADPITIVQTAGVYDGEILTWSVENVRITLRSGDMFEGTFNIRSGGNHYEQKLKARLWYLTDDDREKLRNNLSNPIDKSTTPFLEKSFSN